MNFCSILGLAASILTGFYLDAGPIAYPFKGETHLDPKAC